MRLAVGDVRQRAIGGLAFRVSSAVGSISIAVTMLEPSSMHDMMIAAVASSFRVLRMRPMRLVRIVAVLAVHERHHRHARFEAAQSPSASLGKKIRQADDHRQPAAPFVLDVPIAR